MISGTHTLYTCCYQFLASILSVITNYLFTIDKEFQKVCEKAFDEVRILQEAETRMLFRDCIIRTYGIARGPLPDSLCSIFGNTYIYPPLFILTFFL